MKKAIDETNRRRTKQEKFNKENGIVPKTITKEVRDIIDLSIKDDKTKGKKKMSKSDVEKTVALMTEQMQKAAKNLDFELAAALRDKIFELRANQK